MGDCPRPGAHKDRVMAHQRPAGDASAHGGPAADVDVGLDVHVVERYFTKPAIVRRMPEHSREPRTALALLESEMLLDGDPSKNLATFVTTFMEPEAIDVIALNLHRNFIDHPEYPRTAEVAKRCVRML